MFIMIQFTQTMHTLNIKKRKSSIKIIELWISVNNSVGLESLKNLSFSAHRFIWHVIPNDMEFDHINNCKTDNHINNLKTSHTKGK